MAKESSRSLNGLRIYAYGCMPLTRASVLSSAYAVTKITGTSVYWQILRAVSIPSIGEPSRTISIRMRSGTHSAARAIASSLFAAGEKTEYPMPVRISLRFSATISSSSTIRIFGCPSMVSTPFREP